MPYQNRVDPYGRLHALSARGAWMGNRGVLHNTAQEIVADWRVTRWITCRLSFKGIRRKLLSPNRYTELFFLDEATSLAAGHRPCAECRFDRYKEFCAAWSAGSGSLAQRRRRADDIDRRLHAERVTRSGMKKTYLAALSSLPAGTFVEHESRPRLLWDGRLWGWTSFGYTPAVRSPSKAVRVLTPRSIVRALRAGFVPQVHESASG